MAKVQKSKKGAPKVTNVHRMEHRRVRYLARLRDRVSRLEKKRKSGEWKDKDSVKLDKAYRLLDGNRLAKR